MFVGLFRLNKICLQVFLKLTEGGRRDVSFLTPPNCVRVSNKTVRQDTYVNACHFILH